MVAIIGAVGHTRVWLFNLSGVTIITGARDGGGDDDDDDDNNDSRGI